MSAELSATTRRRFLAASTLAGALGATASVSAETLELVVDSASGAGGSAPDSQAIRPFRVNTPQAALDDLHRRLAATRLPEKETVSDFSQGVPLKTTQQVLAYWRDRYDWRKCEARLNSYPQFLTEIDGLDIHFLHVRSRHESALPVIITHGWPGSVVEQLKLIDPLVNPTAYGGQASDAFHVVIPSMPGYGFSGKPTSVGWGPERIARAWATLMSRLGYKKYVAQGGDWGAIVTEIMGVQAPAGLMGIHTNMPNAIPPEVDQAAFAGVAAPAGLSDEERVIFDQLSVFYKNVYYAFFMGTRPETLVALADSPMGLATFMLDHDGRSLEMIARSFDGEKEGMSPDDVLDNVTLFWLTNTGVSAARLYWENKLPFFAPKGVNLPVVVSAFPDDLCPPPRSWAEKAYPNLIYYKKNPKGGHFAAWEQPAFLIHDMREGLRSLRTA